MAALTLLFFESDAEPPTALDDLEHAVAGLPGVILDGAPGSAYRPGRWRDAATGASAVLDLGSAPIEPDTMHPPANYAGWRTVPLVMHIPLTAPHWHCVEALNVVELLCRRLPQLRALDTEDTQLDENTDSGPYTWNRLRVLANWEQLHEAHSALSRGLHRMERVASIALWRYRRERQRGMEQQPELAWPEALVLLDLSDGPRACSAAAWLDPNRPLAVPPVELLVIQRQGEAGTVPSDELLTATGGGKPLPLAQAIRIDPSERVSGFFERAKLLPAGRFRFLDDGDWSD
jgi:hypothetical protein